MTSHELALQLLALPDVEVRMTIKRRMDYLSVPITKIFLFSVKDERVKDMIYLHENDITLDNYTVWENK